MVGWQEGHPACKKTEWWGAGMVIWLERDEDLHMAQLMPLLLTVSCFSKKSRLVLPFWYRLTRVVLEKGPLNVCSKNHNSHSSNTHKTTLYQVQLLLRMWRNQLKSTSIRFEFCILNAADSDEHLPRDHSLFHWMAIYRCLYIINIKLDDKHWSHSAFTII